MTCVLVTGSSGFVGSAVCEALTERGIEVVGYDLKPSRFTSAPWDANMRFVAGDMRDLDSLETVLADHDITHVVHAAALTPDEQRERSAPDLIADVNVLGATRLLMAVAGRRPRCRVLHLSSIAVYGEAEPGEDGRFREDETTPSPVVLYGVTKFAAEMVLRRLAQLHGLDLCIARLGPLYGPWEHQSGARDILSPHHQIAVAARSGAPCVLPRNVTADWFYSRDAARKIHALLMTEQLPHRLFNLGAGQTSTLIDWCEGLRAAIPSFQWQIDERNPTIRYGYPRDRPPLSTVRLDSVVSPGGINLIETARDYLSWLDRFEPHSQPMENAK